MAFTGKTDNTYAFYKTRQILPSKVAEIGKALGGLPTFQFPSIFSIDNLSLLASNFSSSTMPRVENSEGQIGRSAVALAVPRKANMPSTGSKVSSSRQNVHYDNESQDSESEDSDSQDSESEDSDSQHDENQEEDNPDNAQQSILPAEDRELTQTQRIILAGLISLWVTTAFITVNVLYFKPDGYLHPSPNENTLMMILIYLEDVVGGIFLTPLAIILGAGLAAIVAGIALFVLGCVLAVVALLICLIISPFFLLIMRGIRKVNENRTEHSSSSQTEDIELGTKQGEEVSNIKASRWYCFGRESLYKVLHGQSDSEHMSIDETETPPPAYSPQNTIVASDDPACRMLGPPEFER
ncbi:hypothetical protein BT63DRAFT_451071 [Microthyrium microscopicum]|uniref:Uncharacterized protein n=1 Tax=Microthyrium microscopicum TaxID=703497 RepID=A0A6A6UNL2_9PEZI|nr:hypothetical protein BT63DRAFT_451071 [Microthyrium microscopicum]